MRRSALMLAIIPGELPAEEYGRKRRDRRRQRPQPLDPFAGR